MWARVGTPCGLGGTTAPLSTSAILNQITWKKPNDTNTDFIATTKSLVREEPRACIKR